MAKNNSAEPRALEIPPLMPLPAPFPSAPAPAQRNKKPRAMNPLLIGEQEGHERKFFLIDQFDLMEVELQGLMASPDFDGLVRSRPDFPGTGAHDSLPSDAALVYTNAENLGWDQTGQLPRQPMGRLARERAQTLPFFFDNSGFIE